MPTDFTKNSDGNLQVVDSVNGTTTYTLAELENNITVIENFIAVQQAKLVYFQNLKTQADSLGVIAPAPAPAPAPINIKHFGLNF